MNYRQLWVETHLTQLWVETHLTQLWVETHLTFTPVRWVLTHPVWEKTQ